jgi:hypothetical protein
VRHNSGEVVVSAKPAAGEEQEGNVTASRPAKMKNKERKSTKRKKEKEDEEEGK